MKQSIPYSKQELKIELWKEKIFTYHLPLEYNEFYLSLGKEYVDSIDALYRLHEVVMEDARYFEDKDHFLLYEREGENYYLIYDKREIEFSKQQLLECLRSMIEVFEEVLPLGSVVDLKKEYFPKELPLDQVGKIRMVITHRFLSTPESKGYFTYGGVVYPVGNLGTQGILHFTNSLIERVVNENYKDEQETAFVYTMKRDLLIKKKKHSYGFSSKEELNKLAERIKVMEE